MENEDQELICRYLLGDLSEQQQSELEARYFADDQLFEQLLMVEDELIDKYARNEFSPQERAVVEQHFLRSQVRRKRLMFVQALMKYMASLSQDARCQRVSWLDEMKALFHLNKR